MDSYECSNCGAKVITDKNTTATFCVYCGSTSIIKNRLTDEFRPAKIIPFKNTKNEAIAAFKIFKRGKIFTPKNFSDENNIKKLTGVYIPFWLYDCDVEGDINVSATKEITDRKGNYRYIKPGRYFVKRSGNMCFEKIPVDGSIKFDNNTMDSIEPFDYKELKEFNMSYLSGFLSEKYDVGKEEAYKRVYERIKNTTIDELKSTIRGYDNIRVTGSNVNVNVKKAEYILLPVWMLNIKYKDKMHLFAMNGQTGKMVGDIPVDKKKMFLACICSFFGFIVLYTLIVLILFVYINIFR